MHVVAFCRPIEKNYLKLPEMGPRGFFPTNPDFADILADTDFDLEIFVGSQISRFLDLGTKFLYIADLADMMLDTMLRTILSYIRSSVFHTASQDRSRNQQNVKREATHRQHT